MFRNLLVRFPLNAICEWHLQQVSICKNVTIDIFAYFGKVSVRISNFLPYWLLSRNDRILNKLRFSKIWIGIDIWKVVTGIATVSLTVLILYKCVWWMWNTVTTKNWFCNDVATRDVPIIITVDWRNRWLITFRKFLIFDLLTSKLLPTNQSTSPKRCKSPELRRELIYVF